jgi:hypothetical protein
MWKCRGAENASVSLRFTMDAGIFSYREDASRSLNIPAKGGK